ncbi:MULTISPECIES: hypothetical protein [Cysteiniphilum]|uniref:phage adaptor protein n=1 Tax=Cysteiniphilum TaxID=2056696 RepID=UPI00177EF86F|nr:MULTISPECIES: hypothetical protein [Cysteiniphilum]
MNVSEMIDRLTLLSVGLDSVDTAEKQIFLKYLNIVHFELFRITALFNPYVSATVIEYNSDTANVVLTAKGWIGSFFQKNSHAITGVYYKDSGGVTKLKQTSVSQIFETDPLLEKIDKPAYWYYNNASAYIYPYLNTYPAGCSLVLTYIKNPTPLELTTYEDAVPYPPTFHQLLVDGAAYYMYQSEGGLKNKDEINASLIKYERGKGELLNYFNTLSGNGVISTYSEI